MSRKKGAIQDWLLNKNIHYETEMVKATLLELIPQNESFIKYAVDEMAAQHGVTVLRLLPYHCELNPIELIWAQCDDDPPHPYMQTFVLKPLGDSFFVQHDIFRLGIHDVA